MMNCKRIEEYLPDFIIGDLDETILSEIQEHLNTCDSCSKEVLSAQKVWMKLGTLPNEQPGEATRERFYTMLSAYQEGLSQSQQAPRVRDVINSWIERWWPKNPAIQIGFSMALLLLGIFVGSRFEPEQTGNIQLTALQEEVRTQSQLTALQEDVRSMRQLVSLALLNQESPSERLKGVSFTTKVERPDQEILTALLNTLNNDPNVNVRLAAIQSLFLFSNNPEVKSGLIQSLAVQKSPLIQFELIELLVKKGATQAIETLKQISENDSVNVAVRERAKLGIEQLI